MPCVIAPTPRLRFPALSGLLHIQSPTFALWQYPGVGVPAGVPELPGEPPAGQLKLRLLSPACAFGGPRLKPGVAAGLHAHGLPSPQPPSLPFAVLPVAGGIGCNCL